MAGWVREVVGHDVLKELFWQPFGNRTQQLKRRSKGASCQSLVRNGGAHE